VDTRDSWKLLVFRDGRRVSDGGELLLELSGQIDSVLSLSDFTPQVARDELIDALLRSGELECALADEEGCARPATTLARVTDALADALVAKRRPNFPRGILESLREIPLHQKLQLSVPEGFCYYALHPLDYADLLSESSADCRAAAVIGIRSIGTTLSAVVRAWFELRGIAAERITVRPSGHPFDRKLPVDENLCEWIGKQAQRGARFYVVDEGPGLSGSSFLAVAEALVEAGVGYDRIVLLPSSKPNPETLLAPNAFARWSRFQTLPLQPTRYIPADARQYVGGGEWRKHVFASEADWPAVWSWTERQKYLSCDGARIFRFDGHGRYGKEVRERSEILVAHNWGPQIESAGDGFSVSLWVQGSRSVIADRDTIIQLARYCAFRAKHFAYESADPSALEEMARINLERAAGVSQTLTLPIEWPVVADARMMPHEWIVAEGGRLLKVDAAAHGDDHFYPGPTDIAWDIAGAIVEWNLDDEAANLLISEYCRGSGDGVGTRLPDYLIAYSVFRLAVAHSAAISESDKRELLRFDHEASIYLRRLSSSMHVSTAA
jgi:hypothetical protein